VNQSQSLSQKSDQKRNKKQAVYHGIKVAKQLYQERDLRPYLSEIPQVMLLSCVEEATRFFTRTNSYPRMKPIQTVDQM
jgi:hypothetical protein